MSDVHILAIDLAKRSFQVCGTDPGGAVLFNRTLSRAKLMQMLATQEPCIVAMEACATSHYWDRVAQSSGHDVRLVDPAASSGDEGAFVGERKSYGVVLHPCRASWSCSAARLAQCRPGRSSSLGSGSGWWDIGQPLAG